MECSETKDSEFSAHATLVMTNIKEHLNQKQLCDVTIIGKFMNFYE